MGSRILNTNLSKNNSYPNVYTNQDNNMKAFTSIVFFIAGLQYTLGQRTANDQRIELLEEKLASLTGDVEKLQQTLWFDSYRVSPLYVSGWTPITFDGVRTNTNVLDVYQLKSSGEFRAPIVGAYQFTLQVYKRSEYATIRLRKNQDVISLAYTSDRSSSSYYDSLSTTAMVELNI